MDWLKRLTRNLVSYEDIKKSQTHGGTVIKTHTGQRRMRFWFELLNGNALVSLGIACSVIVTFAFGFFGFPQAFARMGAVVVLSGVVFSVYCVRKIDGILNTEIYKLILKYSQEIAKGLITANRNLSQYSPVKSAASSGEIASAIRKLSTEADRKKRPYYVLEFVLAVAGTLIWAFGDWAVCSIKTWGLSSC